MCVFLFVSFFLSGRNPDSFRYQGWTWVKMSPHHHYTATIHNEMTEICQSIFFCISLFVWPARCLKIAGNLQANSPLEASIAMHESHWKTPLTAVYLHSIDCCWLLVWVTDCCFGEFVLIMGLEQFCFKECIKKIPAFTHQHSINVGDTTYEIKTPHFKANKVEIWVITSLNATLRKTKKWLNSRDLQGTDLCFIPLRLQEIFFSVSLKPKS